MSTTASRLSNPASLRPESAIGAGAALRGWKQIAAYLHRDVRTVQRWERAERLPIHRQLHAKLGTIHAIRAELDQWLAGRTSLQAEAWAALRIRDPRAYELCVRARQLMHQFRRKSFERAREMFGRAIALDPQFAIGHSGLADCCSYLYLYWEPTVDNLRTADSASRRAVTLSPRLAEAQVSRAIALSTLRNYPEANQTFRLAIEIDPELFEAHYFYGRACLAQGRFKEAVVPLRAACRVRAEDYQAPAMLALAYTGLGRRKAAARAHARTVVIAKQQLSVNPGDVRALYLGAGCLARLGRRKTALAWAARALDLDGKDSAVLYNVGCLYAILGRTNEALRCLKKVVRSGWRKEWIKHDPDWAALRDLKEFAALVS
ncbi:MAG TPA: tetratricopeptide repeat protein [Steroidobacteraceae bacterium]|nr:tetratricopeptide repeat protein [Steroidobacteraceae bacterium]